MTTVKSIFYLIAASSLFIWKHATATNVLFGLQEVTKPVEHILKDLAPSGIAIFSGPHAVFDAKQLIREDFSLLPKRTAYQEVGTVSSFSIRSISQLQKAKLHLGGLVIPQDPFNFAMNLPHFDESNNELLVHLRHFQLFEFSLGDQWHPVINVHYHHDEAVNKLTKGIMGSLIELTNPAIVLGDFNSDEAIRGYHDIVNEDTFPDKINGTGKLDHIFIRNDLPWTVEVCPLGRIKNTFISHAKPDPGYGPGNYEQGKGKGRYFAREDGNPFLSDHAIIVYKVFDPTSGESFLLGSFNILAPHDAVMEPWIDPRLKKWVVDRGEERIKLLVDTVRAIQSNCLAGNTPSQSLNGK